MVTTPIGVVAGPPGFIRSAGQMGAVSSPTALEHGWRKSNHITALPMQSRVRCSLARPLEEDRNRDLRFISPVVAGVIPMSSCDDAFRGNEARQARHNRSPQREIPADKPPTGIRLKIGAMLMNRTSLPSSRSWRTAPDFSQPGGDRGRNFGSETPEILEPPRRVCSQAEQD